MRFTHHPIEQLSGQISPSAGVRFSHGPKAKRALLSRSPSWGGSSCHDLIAQYALLAISPDRAIRLACILKAQCSLLSDSPCRGISLCVHFLSSVRALDKISLPGEFVLLMISQSNVHFRRTPLTGHFRFACSSKLQCALLLKSPGRGISFCHCFQSSAHILTNSPVWESSFAYNFRT